MLNFCKKNVLKCKFRRYLCYLFKYFSPLQIFVASAFKVSNNFFIHHRKIRTQKYFNSITTCTLDPQNLLQSSIRIWKMQQKRVFHKLFKNSFTGAFQDRRHFCIGNKFLGKWLIKFRPEFSWGREGFSERCMGASGKINI